MKALIRGEGLKLTNMPIPPARDFEVIAKVLAASYSHIDKAADLGLIPYYYGVIAGSIGLIRVIEPDLERKTKEGELYLTLPSCGEEIHGITAHGFLSEYCKVNRECLIKVPQKVAISDDLMLAFELSYLSSLDEIISDLSDILIVGCNIDAYITVKYLESRYNLKVLCVDGNLRDHIASLGPEMINIEKIKGFYDALIVTSTTPLITHPKLLSCLRERGKLIIPPTQPPLYISLWYIRRSLSIIIPRLKLSNTVLDLIKAIPKTLKRVTIAITNELEFIGSLSKRYERVMYLATKAR